MKRLIAIFILLCLATTALSACKKPEATEGPNPVSDFEYKINGEQVTITKYIGTDKTVTIPETIEEKIVTEIGYQAFAKSIITECVLPSTIRKIDMLAFALCSDLEKITLNEGLLAIGDYALEGASALTEIVIPSTVLNINESAFKSCNTLTAVKFEGNAPNAYESPEADNSQGSSYSGSYTVYYHANAQGFSSPWCGYNTENW